MVGTWNAHRSASCILLPSHPHTQKANGNPQMEGANALWVHGMYTAVLPAPRSALCSSFFQSPAHQKAQGIVHSFCNSREKNM